MRERESLRKESADRRVAAKQADDAKAAAEKAKAEAEGRWQDVGKIEREKADALAKEAETLRSRAARADALEADRTTEAMALRAALGDRASVVPDSLPPETQVSWLKSISAAASGRPAAPATAAGNPAAPATWGLAIEVPVIVRYGGLAYHSGRDCASYEVGLVASE